MTASPIKSTIAKINAAQLAVIDMAALAMAKARHIGTPTRDPISAIHDQRVKRQARRLLLSAATHLYGVNALNVRQILVSLSGIDLAHPDDFEALAECWQRIEDIARDQARECHEYAGSGE